MLGRLRTRLGALMPAALILAIALVEAAGKRWA
jgi:hypothetical protein